MKTFLLVIAIVFIVLLAFYIFVSIRMNIILKDRKEEYLNKLSDKEKDIIRNYLETSRVSLKDVFSPRKR